MNEKNMFKNNTAEFPKAENNLDKIESTESEEQLEKQLESETEKLEANFDKLQEDIKSFGGEEKLAAALEKNPSIAKRIMIRAAKISAFVAPVMFASSIVNGIANLDASSVAVTLMEISAISVVAAMATYKSAERREAKIAEKHQRVSGI